jgi:hypothetical protein
VSDRASTQPRIKNCRLADLDSDEEDTKVEEEEEYDIDAGVVVVDDADDVDDVDDNNDDDDAFMAATVPELPQGGPQVGP